jgi:PPOX class probable F420-dependent enzyme
VATVATVGPDGRPQVSAVWFLNDDGTVKVSLNVARQKTKNLTANPAVTVFILDPANPARYLEIRGDATLEPDDDYAFADRLGAKYGGADLRAMDGPDGRRVVVSVDPVRINAVDLSAG